MSNVKELKDLNATSVSISKSVTTLGKEIHVHMLDMMNRVIIHRDTTAFGYFLSLMSKTDKAGNKTSIVRSEAIKRWAMDFGFVTFSSNKDSGKLETKLNKAAYNLANGDGFKTHKDKAKVNPWNRYTVEPAAIDKPFDVEAYIDGLIKAAEKTLNDAKAGEGRFERQTDKARKGNKYASERLDKLFALRREESEAA